MIGTKPLRDLREEQVDRSFAVSTIEEGVMQMLIVFIRTSPYSIFDTLRNGKKEMLPYAGHRHLST